jgi:hypothetical protein
MKNIDILKRLEAESNAIEDALLAKFLEGKTVPMSLWENACNAGVREWLVTQIRSDHGRVTAHPWIKRPSNEDIAKARSAVDRLKLIGAADPMKVYIHVKRDSASSGVPWARMEDGKYGYHRTRELAEEANRQWHEDHDPRPGHFECNYCRKQTPNEKMVRRNIFVNRGVQSRCFCSDQCATHDQFASEG